jgi:hypothetical protein
VLSSFRLEIGIVVAASTVGALLLVPQKQVRATLADSPINPMIPILIEQLLNSKCLPAGGESAIVSASIGMFTNYLVI